MQTAILYLYHGNETFSSSAYRGFADYAKANGWSVQRVDFPFSISPERLSNLISFWAPRGIVYDVGSCKRDCAWIAGLCLPIVMIDADTTSFSVRCPRLGFVNCDSDSLANLAAKSFFQRGLRHFAFVSANRSWYWSKSRQAAFRTAIELNGARLSTFDGSSLSTDSPHALGKLRAWLGALPKPCGLLAANDKIGALVLAVAKQASIAVPEDLNVIGIDDNENVCERTSPPLTSIQIDFSSGGAAAGQLLNDLLKCRSSASVQRFYGVQRLTERLSTRRLLKPSPSVRLALETIRRRAADGIASADILPLLGKSRRSAEQRFREATGKSILEEILDVRFDKVLRLLDNNDVCLNAIAGLAGFSSENHLRRQFKSRFGMSMTKFRNVQNKLNRRKVKSNLQTPPTSA